jgi:hypothetical protein
MASSQPRQATTFLFYVVLLLVTGSSVVFGLDWLRAPLPPMHETEATVQAAKAAAKFPPPVQRVAKAAPRVIVPAVPTVPGRAVAAIDVNNPPPPITQAPMPEVAAPERAAQPERESLAKCDIDACAAAYRSFRESDCTWQPFNGPRRFCDRGTPPRETASAAPNATPQTDPQVGATPAAPDVQVSNKCDQDACKHAYFTFDPADCTYQPTHGPRRLCDRGTPPKPDQAATEPAPGETAAAEKPKTDGEQAPNAPKCNIEACRRAYFTFTPEDCTYQPSDGTRRLCTK